MRNNRARRADGRVIVDGWRETAQAIAAGLELVQIYHLPPDGSVPAHSTAEVTSSREAAEPSRDSHDWQQRVFDDPVAQRRTQWVTPAVLDKIGYGQSSRGVVAEFKRPKKPMESLRLGKAPVVMILDQIEKPGNVGAIFRSADAAGVDAVLVCGSGDPLHPNAIRSSSGGVFHVPWAEASLTEMGEFLLKNEFRVFAARVEASVPCWKADFSGPTAIVVGNEAEGLGDRWNRLGDQETEGIHIPMAGQVDSLNVSVAAAVLAFWATQSRR